MGKISGLGMTVAVDDAAGAAQTITNDINDITVDTSRGSEDVTGLDKSAIERIALLTDATVTMKGTFNATGAHAVFKSLVILAGQVGRTVTITYPGAVVLEMEIVFESYNVVRAANGALTWTASGKLASGIVPTGW
ncbi:hypothetical protein MUP35_00755 [Patescibacteria group bacterium]|nr:hypothetical protein [Patescibacteria group bacterium]